MTDVNTKDTFQQAFQQASDASSGLGVTYSDVFRTMENLSGGFASGDFVREQLQAGINDGTISVAYGVLNSADQIVSTFSGLINEPELEEGQSVEPIYSPA